jgi:hypothetical protein
LTAAAVPLSACMTSNVWTNSKSTAIQQLVTSRATDRAFEKIQWPDLGGGKVFVRVGATPDYHETGYLAEAAAVEVARHGGRPVADQADADYVLTVLAGSYGTVQNDTFVGIPSVQSALVPVVATPEVALYKSTRQNGIVNAHLVLWDARKGGVIFDSGPQAGESQWTQYGVLFFGFHHTDAEPQP